MPYDKDAMAKLLSDFLKTYHCNGCGNKLTGAKVTVLGQTEYQVLAHVSCPHCGAEHMINATAQEKAAMTFRSDLLPAEIEKFHKAEPISSNDLLDLHQFLKSFNGDFKNFFASQKRPLKGVGVSRPKMKRRSHQLFR